MTADPNVAPPTVDPASTAEAPPDDRIEHLACVVVMLSYVVQNVLTVKRPNKSEMAVDLNVVTDQLKAHFPASFPPVT